MAILRAAVVGAGILGRRHARVIQEIDGVALSAVVSRTAASADALAGAHGVPAYTDVEAMLAAVECDVVVVATPDHLHAPAVLAALAHGKDVLVEKPLATRREDAMRMIAAAAERERVLQVNYSQRHVAEFAWMKEQVAAGAIGRPVMVQSSKQDTIWVPTRMIGWAAETSPIFFMTSHDMDLAAWFLGARAVRVLASEQRGVLEARGLHVHDGVDAIVTYDTGATAHYHSSWIHPETWPFLVTERITIIGESGVLHFENEGRRVQCYNASGGKRVEFTGPTTATEVDGRLVGAFRTSLESFFRCVRERVEPETSAARTLHVTETQLAVLEAVATGEPVAVRG